MSEGIKSLAKNLQGMGRGKDTILAHIMPEEAAMLKAHGGSGTVNPKTGLLEFGVDSGPEAGSTGSAAGNSYSGSSGSDYSGYTGGSDLGGYSGSGNTTYSNNSVGGGGGGGSIGGTTTSPTMGGYVSTGGKDTSYSGGGTGSAFDLSGFVTGNTPMTIGGTGMGIGGSNASFGLTGVVPYSGGDGGNTGWASQYGSAAPAYTVTSQPDTFGVPTVVANAMQSMGTFFGSTLPNAATSAWNAMTSIPNVPESRFNVQPQTVQQPGFGEGIPQSEVDKANAAGYLAGNFNDPFYGDTTAARTQYAASVPTDAPTGDYLGYSYTPPSDGSYIGSTTENEFDRELAASMPAWMSSNEPLFDQAAFDKEMADFRAGFNTQFNEPAPVDYSGAEADRAPTDVTASAPFLGSPSPVVMGQGLDLGNQIVGNPLFADVSVTNPTYSVDVPEMISLAKTYEKSPVGISFAGDRTIYDRAIPGLSDYGATFTPDTDGVNLAEDTSYVPKTGIASIPNSSYFAPENQQFFEHFSPSLTQLTPETLETQWGSSTMGASPYVQSEVQPQTFGSMYGLSVLDTLNADFEQQAQPLTRGITVPETTTTSIPSFVPNQYQKLQPGQVPLYGEAIPYSGPKGALPMTQEQRWTGGGLFSDLEDQYNLPQGYLGKTYGVESGYGTDLGSPDAGAYGPFQFMRDTAENYGLIADGVDQRADLIQSADAAARLAADNAEALRDIIGRQPTVGELYLAHQQGPTVAGALLANPTQPAIDIISKFYDTYDRALRALVGNGGNITMTAGEFAQKWSDKIASKEADPSGGQPTQYALNIEPTTAPKYRSLAEVPVDEVAQNPTIVSDLLEEEFNASFGGGGGGSGRPSNNRPAQPPAPDTETPAPEPEPTPTTGINLSRRVYDPSKFAFVPTASPAYS